ncbi:MAG TPA: hypothetical protein GX507_11795, partial [Clostridia bacterium]|nr:hypothetical protein [Clostridia bacterium]
GVHHIAYETDDIEGDLERIKSMGIEAIDQKPRPGLEGTLVAFFHPKSCGGVLTELVWYDKYWHKKYGKSFITTIKHLIMLHACRGQRERI